MRGCRIAPRHTHTLLSLLLSVSLLVLLLLLLLLPPASMKSVTSFCLATTSLSTSTLPDDSTVVLDVFAVVKSTTDIASDSAVDVVDAVDVVVDDVATVDVDDSASGSDLGGLSSSVDDRLDAAV
jgi:hypothetical protein